MKEQFLTMKYHFKTSNRNVNILRFLCLISNTIYNESIYNLRQMFFKDNTICSFFDLEKIIFKVSEASHILNTYQSLCTIRMAYDNMKKHIKRLNKEKYCKEHEYKLKESKCSLLPSYKYRYRYFPLVTDQIRILMINNKKYIKLPLSNIVRTNKIFNSTYSNNLLNDFINKAKEKLDAKINNIFIKIPKELYNSRINQIRIVPDKYGNHFNIEFSYVVDAYLNLITNNEDSIGIDIGISNLASCITTNNASFIIDGKRLKSINQYFNKKLAMARSKLPKNKYYSKYINNLFFHRNNKVEDYLNKATKTLVSKVIELNIKNVVIGWNKGISKGGIKSNAIKSTKKKINQSFVGLPLARFKNKLKAKLASVGAKVNVINESYTSKCSFLDDESIEKHEHYLGERKTRSLFITNNKIKMHADINAAANILRKCNSKHLDNIKDAMSRGLTIPYRVLINL